MTSEPRPVTPNGILAARLEQLVRSADAAAAVDAGFRAGLREAWRLARGLDQYVTVNTTPESPALRALTERTRAEDWTRREGPVAQLEQEMLSGHVEGQALRLLVRATRARRVLDIGMFTGYSALAMAEAMPADGVVVACELDPYVASFARDCFKSSDAGGKVEVRLGPALDTLAELARAGDVFDLVFLDADKASYYAYLDVLLTDHLLAPHALICVDNTLLQGQPWGVGELTDNGRAIAGFNRAVALDPRIEQVLLPLRDGLTRISRVDPPGARPA